MKKNKKNGFTIGEAALTLACLAILITICVSIIRPTFIANKALYISAYTNLQKMSAATLNIKGQTINTTDGAVRVLPAALCAEMGNIANSVGTTNCAAPTLPNGSNGVGAYNIKLANSQMLYNVQAAFPASLNTVAATKASAIAVYVNIDGNGGVNKLNNDVVAFSLRRDGIVIPATDALSNEYLKFDVYVMNKSDKNLKNAVAVFSNLTFNQASCKANEFIYTGCTGIEARCQDFTNYYCVKQVASIPEFWTMFSPKS